MLMLFLKWTLTLGVGGFWDDTEVGVFMVPVLAGIENNCNPLPIIVETPPDFLADF